MHRVSDVPCQVRWFRAVVSRVSGLAVVVCLCVCLRPRSIAGARLPADGHVVGHRRANRKRFHLSPQGCAGVGCCDTGQCSARLVTAWRVPCEAVGSRVAPRVVRTADVGDADVQGQCATSGVNRSACACGHVVQGQVADANAFAMGGIAGHAGVFRCVCGCLAIAKPPLWFPEQLWS